LDDSKQVHGMRGKDAALHKSFRYGLKEPSEEHLFGF